MNPTLARLYGTGMSKTASAGEIDLSQISAADYLEFLNGQEKVANDDGELDLSQLSAQELIDLAAELENEDPIEKMASSGELSYWDAAGRVMAHAYADEMSKVAGTDLPEIIDVDALSAQELVELVESGEYELVKEAESMFSRGTKAAKAYLQRAKGAAGAMAARAGSAAKAERARAAAKNLMAMTRKGPGNLGPGGMAALRTSGGKAQLKELAKGIGETGAVYGVPAAGLAGAALAIKKMKERRNS